MKHAKILLGGFHLLLRDIYVKIVKNTRSYSDKTVIVLKKVYETGRMLRT